MGLGLFLSLAGLLNFASGIPVFFLEEIESLTGISWSELVGTNPGMAAVILVPTRMYGLAALGLGIWLVLIAYFPFRRGERWTWYAFWRSGYFRYQIVQLKLHPENSDGDHIGHNGIGITTILIRGKNSFLRHSFTKETSKRALAKASDESSRGEMQRSLHSVIESGAVEWQTIRIGDRGEVEVE